MAMPQLAVSDGRNGSNSVDDEHLTYESIKNYTCTRRPEFDAIYIQYFLLFLLPWLDTFTSLKVALTVLSSSCCLAPYLSLDIRGCVLPFSQHTRRSR